MKKLFVSVVALLAAVSLSAQDVTAIYNEAAAAFGAKDFAGAAAKFEQVIEQGLDSETALRMTALTMEGAARMLLESGRTAAELTRQVCSPGGTTLAGLTAFDDYHFEEMISQAEERCVKRSKELGR